MATPKRLRPVRWAYDLLREKFKPRQKPLTPPGVGVFDSPSACLKVNLQWSSHVIGVLEVLNQSDSWAGTDLQQFNAQQEIEKLLNALAVESECDSSPMLEDTLANSIFDLTDGLLQTTQSGGVITPAGYLIDDSANIAITTESRIISVTVLGKDTGGVMSIYQDGLLQDYPVPVGVGEKIEVIFDTLTTSAKVMSFVFESL